MSGPVVSAHYKSRKKRQKEKLTQVAHTPLVCPKRLVPSQLCFDALHVILIRIIKHRSEFYKPRVIFFFLS